MTQTIELKDRADAPRFNHGFNKVIGSCHLGTMLYERTLRHMEMAHRDLGVRYLRCHGLLSGSPDLCSWATKSKMGLEPELGFDVDQLSQAGDILHNFAFIDLITDRLLDIGIRPFVEIGFMPRILASSRHSITRYDAYTSPPRDYKLWSDLIEHLVGHWRRRYGLAEISQWYYEVWNEPNLDGFWSGGMPEYFKLYDTTARAVKSVHGDLRVGGPATAGRANAHIDAFLRFCKEHHTPVDFVTSHSYADRSSNYVGEFCYHQMREPTFLPNRFRQMREEIDASPFPGLPLHITEYNSTVSSRELIHDLPFNAAYLGQTLSEAGQYAETFSYWAVSDIFTEEGVPPAEFHGGFGMINIHDIPKPTYHLFHFFSQLGDRVLSRDPRHLFTRRDDGHLVGVLWNPNDSSRDSQSQHYRITLPRSDTPYAVRTLRVDEHHANPYRAWEMLGRHRNPSRRDVELIREASRPAVAYQKLETRDGAPQIELTLEKNAVMLIEIIPVDDHSAQYHGLDPAACDSFAIPRA